MLVGFFWRTMTMLTHVLLDNHCISYIIFCHPEDSAAAFLDYLCSKVTVKAGSYLSLVLCKSCCRGVQQCCGAGMIRRLVTVVVQVEEHASAADEQLDPVLTSWMCVAYEKTGRG